MTLKHSPGAVGPRRRREIRWVLAPDVRIRSLNGLDRKDLLEILGEQPGRDGETHVVYRESARSLPIAVNRSVLRVLRRFRKPAEFLQVVLQVATGERADPREVLSDLKTLVGRLVSAEILVRPESLAKGRAGRWAPTLRPGQRVLGYVVRECIRSLTDSEVYRLRPPGGGPDGAFKVLRPSFGSPRARGEAAERLCREGDVLRALRNSVACPLLRRGTYRGRPYLLVRWIDGESPLQQAERLRKTHRDPLAAQDGLVDLARRCLSALSTLHAKGFLHGDFHPGNILVSDDGTVRLIDFGLAARIREAPAAPEKPAGGVIQYLSPEEVARLSGSRSRPRVGLRSEVYAAAVLVYELLTGNPYLPPCALRTTAMEQILLRPPLRFAELGQNPWPEVEAVLAKALAKDPSARYSTIAELSRALASAAARPRRAPAGDRRRRLRRAFTTFSTSTLQDLRRMSYRSLREAQAPPYAGIATGGAGMAYALWKAATRWNDADLLAQADHWAAHALASIGEPAALYAPKDGLDRREVRKSSFFYGLTGLHFVQALTAHSMDDPTRREGALSAFVAACRASKDGPLELLQGEAGCLLACVLLSREITDVRLERAGAELAGHLLARAFPRGGGGSPWSVLRYYGMAHGWGGVYYSLLQWSSRSGRRLPAWFIPALEDFAASGTLIADGVNWPVAIRAKVPVFTSRWCNGSGGLALLWTRAFELTGKASFLEAARRSARDLAAHADGNEDLCCGNGGRAYSFLALHRVDPSPEWETPAHDLAARALSSPTASHGLLKGRAGLLCLAGDLLEGTARAAFPCLES